MITLEWQQILTHALGFLIVLWILKKYAWGPLLGMLEERRQKIVDEFQKIDDERAATEKLKGDYEGKLKNIEVERRQKIAEAVNEANKMASDIQVEAQQKARDMINQTKEQLARDIASAKIQLKEEMVSITMSAAEKILREKLDEAKERELIGRYIEEIEKA
jgi:F-type H+-transporting ATPase subunit b